MDVHFPNPSPLPLTSHDRAMIWVVPLSQHPGEWGGHWCIVKMIRVMHSSF